MHPPRRTTLRCGTVWLWAVTCRAVLRALLYFLYSYMSGIIRNVISYQVPILDSTIINKSGGGGSNDGERASDRATAGDRRRCHSVLQQDVVPGTIQQ